MIAFFDTSALVKVFVTEAHSESVRQWAGAASTVMVSEITWVELCAAIAFKRRTGQLAPANVAPILALVEDEWPRYHRLSVDTDLLFEAGALALQHDLRAYDSLQLATALRAFRTVGPTLRLCCFDKALNRAAKLHGLTAIDPGDELG